MADGPGRDPLTPRPASGNFPPRDRRSVQARPPPRVRADPPTPPSPGRSRQSSRWRQGHGPQIRRPGPQVASRPTGRASRSLFHHNRWWTNSRQSSSARKTSQSALGNPLATRHAAQARSCPNAGAATALIRRSRQTVAPLCVAGERGPEADQARLWPDRAPGRTVRRARRWPQRALSRSGPARRLDVALDARTHGLRALHTDVSSGGPR